MYLSLVKMPVQKNLMAHLQTQAYKSSSSASQGGTEVLAMENNLQTCTFLRSQMNKESQWSI